MNNIERRGRLTSSNIYHLTKKATKLSSITKVKWGATALTYFEEKRIERKLERCLDTGAYSQPIAWGNFMERVIFEILGLEYKIESRETSVHPEPEFESVWAGSYDLIVPDIKIGEIKCYQAKKFCQYTDAITQPITEDFTLQDKLNNLKDNFAQEYWQMVSNAIIQEVPNAEAITYMPYESEMEEIREMAADVDEAEQWKYRFIYEKGNEHLPVLKDGGYYNNLNKFEFEVPLEDIKLLTSRVRLAIPELAIPLKNLAI